MGLETFPEIENFQKLPHQVIVKGGKWSFSEREGAQLRGIVINNIGHAIKDVKVSLVIFNDQRIPVLNTSCATVPALLPQGGMAAFAFQIKDHSQVLDHHLYADWKFDELA